MMPGQFGPISRVFGVILEERHRLQHVDDVGMPSVMQTDERDARVGRFHDRVGAQTAAARRSPTRSRRSPAPRPRPC